jgi:hypothetical protein
MRGRSMNFPAILAGWFERNCRKLRKHVSGKVLTHQA